MLAQSAGTVDYLLHGRMRQDLAVLEVKDDSFGGVCPSVNRQ